MNKTVIDSHQHFWKYHPIRYHLISDSMKTISRDFMPQDLRSILNANAFNGCIAIDVFFDGDLLRL